MAINAQRWISQVASRDLAGTFAQTIVFCGTFGVGMSG